MRGTKEKILKLSFFPLESRLFHEIPRFSSVYCTVYTIRKRFRSSLSSYLAIAGKGTHRFCCSCGTFEPSQGLLILFPTIFALLCTSIAHIPRRLTSQDACAKSRNTLNYTCTLREGIELWRRRKGCLLFCLSLQDEGLPFHFPSSQGTECLFSLSFASLI